MATKEQQIEHKAIELSYRERQVSEEDMRAWMDAQMNVLFVGERGTGKTARILGAFNQKYGKKWAYFSGATLDPWIHVVGVPKPVKKTIIIDGKEETREVLDFVLPENLQDDVEAIFVDEWNRMHKVAKNALMELQQFKSINGRKFPNLKVLWAAINPPNEDEGDPNSYTVEPSDPAQLDRFQVIVRIPNEPFLPFFRNTFGHNGEVICKWYRDQPKTVKRVVSPRRLEYVLNAHEKGVNIRDLLPEDANVNNLLDNLSKDASEEAYFAFRAAPSQEAFKKLVKNAQDWENQKERLISDNYWEYISCLDEEVFCNECVKNPDFGSVALALGAKRLYGFDKIFQGLKDSNLAKAWNVAERQLRGTQAKDIFDIEDILVSDESIKGPSPAFQEGEYAEPCSNNGANWKGKSGGLKVNFLNKVLLKRADINWGDKETQEIVVNFLCNLVNLLQKDVLEQTFLEPINKIVVTLMFNGVNRENNERLAEFILRLDKKLGRPAISQINVALKPRSKTQIENIIENEV